MCVCARGGHSRDSAHARPLALRSRSPEPLLSLPLCPPRDTRATPRPSTSILVLGRDVRDETHRHRSAVGEVDRLSLSPRTARAITRSPDDKRDGKITRRTQCALCVKHRISGFGQWVRPAEALGRQGTASWPVVPSLTPPKLRGREPPCAGQRAARARPSRRAGRPKPRHAKVQVRPCRPSLAEHALLGAKRKRNTSLVRGQKPVRSRPAHPGPGTANGRGFAVQVQSGPPIRPCLTHRVCGVCGMSRPGTEEIYCVYSVYR